MAKNYYLILGVASDASPQAIKAAFRRRALELHPDKSGLESGPFLEVQEAYDVLSDHDRRRHYDNRTRITSVPRNPHWPPAESLVGQRPKAEPFRPVSAGSSFQDISLAESFEPYRTSFRELFGRWWSSFF